jgi:flavin-dependent dehydrogenase
MNENRYDIAVIGGGLAGLSLAIQCAGAGYSVVVLEKEQYPFHKVCGEYLSLESRGFLERLGLPLQSWQLPQINRLLLSDPHGQAYTALLPQGGLGISRYMLDNALYELALKKGVHVLTQTKVQDVQFRNNRFVIHADPGRRITAFIAAGAFGKRSNLDVKWKRPFVQQPPGKLNNYIGIKYHIRYNHPEDTIALHNFEDGYCGISRIEDGKCCLCYLTTAANLQKHNNSIQQMEREILYRNPYLKKIFTTAAFLYEQPLAISQISFSKKAAVENHMLMAGDAAGMITPLCGNGMSMALHGAKLAFEQIHDLLQQKVTRREMERCYRQHWRKHFTTRLFMGRVLQSFLGTESRATFLVGLMRYMPLLARQIIRSTHGKPF